jgi:hypothetical protein
LLKASDGTDLNHYDGAFVRGCRRQAAQDGFAGRIRITGWWIFASIPLTAVAMKPIRVAARSRRPQDRKLTLALASAVTTFCVAMVAGRDPWRSELYDYLVNPFGEGWEKACLLAEPVRLAARALAGFAVSTRIRNAPETVTGGRTCAASGNRVQPPDAASEDAVRWLAPQP